MSRWTNNFKNHPFQNVWTHLKERAESLDTLDALGLQGSPVYVHI